MIKKVAPTRYGIYNHHFDAGLYSDFIFASSAKYEITTFCILA